MNGIFQRILPFQQTSSVIIPSCRHWTRVAITLEEITLILLSERVCRLMQNKIKFISKEAANIFMVTTKLLTKHANGQHIMKDLLLGQFMQLWICKLYSHVLVWPLLTEMLTRTHILTASHGFDAYKNTQDKSKSKPEGHNQLDCRGSLGFPFKNGQSKFSAYVASKKKKLKHERKFPRQQNMYG